jgi:hypothetical protein
MEHPPGEISMTGESQRRNAFIWLVAALAGIIVGLVPMVHGVSIEEGVPMFIALGAILVIAGLVAAPIYFRRARVLAGMASGKKFLAHWTANPGATESVSAPFRRKA